MHSQIGTGPIRNPGVLANLATDSHATTIEEKIADRIGLAVKFRFATHIVRPALKPARLVVDPLASQILFANESQNLTIGN